MNVAIIGSGTMGSGIAQVAAEKGLEVVLYDMKREQLDKALKTINGLLQKKVDKGKMAQAEKDAALARIQAVDSLGEKAAACDFVIEAIFENFAVKVQLFQELDKVCKPEAIIISNTSTLSISKMAEAFRDPTRFMGMHFFSPVPVMRLIEVVQIGRIIGHAATVRSPRISGQAHPTPSVAPAEAGATRFSRHQPGHVRQQLRDHFARAQFENEIILIGKLELGMHRAPVRRGNGDEFGQAIQLDFP